MALQQRYWQTRFARWQHPAKITREGYTVLVPVPGDLPVFLDLALAVIRAQTAPHRVATIVVPDVETPEVDAILARARPDWPGQLERARIPVPERWTLPRLGDPGRNHAIQLNSAISRATSTHVVLHDADLFLLVGDIHERQWTQAVERNLDALGIEVAWDGWYAEHGVPVAATWELTARTDWLRSFPPWRHIAHDDALDGEAHMFDTTYWAQTRTPAGRIDIRPPGDVVHFNYVISTYRKYRQTTGGFRDGRFRLLLIRVFIDLFDTAGISYGLPPVEDLAAGLGNRDAAVWYAPEDAANYAEFRPRLAQILAAFPPPTHTSVDEALGAFDAFYGGRVPVDA
jgi:hypothetical protein